MLSSQALTRAMCHSATLCLYTYNSKMDLQEADSTNKGKGKDEAYWATPEGYIRHFIFEDNKEKWGQYEDIIKINCPFTYAQLKNIGYLPEGEGTKECQKLVSAPVIGEEIAYRLWQKFVTLTATADENKKSDAPPAAANAKRKTREAPVDHAAELDPIWHKLPITDKARFALKKARETCEKEQEEVNKKNKPRAASAPLIERPNDGFWQPPDPPRQPGVPLPPRKRSAPADSAEGNPTADAEEEAGSVPGSKKPGWLRRAARWFKRKAREAETTMLDSAEVLGQGMAAGALIPPESWTVSATDARFPPVQHAAAGARTRQRPQAPGDRNRAGQGRRHTA